MNIEFLIKTEKDGQITISCPRIPGCEATAENVEKAADILVEKITETIAADIKKNVKAILSQLPKKLPSKMPAEFGALFTNFPVNLN